MTFNRKLVIGLYGLNGFFPRDIKPYEAAATLFNMSIEPHKEINYTADLKLSIDELISQLGKLQRPTYNALFVADERLRDKKGLNSFGLTDPKARVIVFSEVALGSGINDAPQERILKEVAHLVGHLWGLGHCDDASCIMSFARTVEEVDLKLPRLCNDHSSLFKQAYRAFIGEG